MDCELGENARSSEYHINSSVSGSIQYKKNTAQPSMNMSENLTSELWLKIDQLHLKYLQSEDTPAKLDIRKKLEGELIVCLMLRLLLIKISVLGLVADYLSIVPQQRKFVNPSTGDIVANSAKWKPDFSLIKAANAFRAIEQYAANLINQPWR